MPEARYWRASGMEAYARGELEISALHLYSGEVGDPDYQKVALLLPGDEAFTDKGALNQTLTIVNGTPTNSTSLKKMGSGAMDFRRTGAVGIPAGMDFGTGDFTVEGWFYWNVLGGGQEWGAFQLSTSGGYEASPASLAVYTRPGDVYGLYFGSIITTSAVATEGTWQHIAITREGSTVRFFIDGAIVHSFSSSFNFTEAGGVLGGYYGATYNGNLMIDDFRVTKGKARYVANFSPPINPHPTALVGAELVLERVDADATLTISLPPVTGTVAALQDEDLLTSVSFNPDVPGLSIAWDFGEDVEKSVVAIRVGSSANKEKFMAALDLQYSSDGKIWTQLFRKSKLIWPGPNALTNLPEAGVFNIPEAVLFLELSSSINDASVVGRTMTANAGASLASGQAYFGAQALLLNGSTQYLSSPGTPNMAFSSSDDFTVSFWARKTANGTQGYDGVVSTTTNSSATNGWVVELSSVRGFIFAANTVNLFSYSVPVNDGAWRHYEITRASGVLRAFVGGVKVYEGANTTALSQAALYIGCWHPGAFHFSGHLQQVLIVKGKALHTANFTPASLVIAASDVEAMPPVVGSSSFDTAVTSTVEPFTVQKYEVRSEDVEHGGLGRVYGTVKEKNLPANTPLRRRVFLMDQRSRLVVRETWSDAATGDFEFRFVKEGIKWFVYSLDHEGHYAPTSADNQEAERMVLP